MLENEEKRPAFVIKDAKDLEQILKICAKLNVSQIKFGDVHVIFGGDQPVPFKKPSKAMIREQEQTETTSFFQEQSDRVSEEIGVSHIEDPLAYEEALAKGLLSDGRKEEEQY